MVLEAPTVVVLETPAVVVVGEVLEVVGCTLVVLDEVDEELTAQVYIRTSSINQPLGYLVLYGGSM